MRTALTVALEFVPGGFGCELLPELVHCGFNVWTRRQPQNLGRHSHPDAWEIHYLVRGQIDQWIADRTHIVRTNDLFVMAPGAVHGGMDLVMHRCEMCWINFRMPPQGSLPGLSASEVARLGASFATIQPRPFPAEAGLAASVAGLLTEGTQSDRRDASIARAYLHRILLGVSRSWSAQLNERATPAPFTPAVAASIALLRTRLAAPIRVESLAKAVGVSRSALNDRFVAETGLSPAEYLTRLRIERAKTLLGHATLSESAFALGFASAQHLGTVFKRQTGMTPGQWRRRSLASPEDAPAPTRPHR